ncbi:DUF1648 domain-containing protein, partial [Bradyrhizobium sp. 76]|uniref:DUF1648 domain-containing protein n=1 Tax=Bradyrhizobium sp. 76 TaxID=2782680 RepID=UPI001FF7E7AD
MLPADYVFGFAVALVVGLNLYLGPRIESERVAMQWGPNGEPTWCAPKWLAMWGMIAFMAAVRLFIWLASTYAPQHVHDSHFLADRCRLSPVRFDEGESDRLNGAQVGFGSKCEEVNLSKSCPPCLNKRTSWGDAATRRTANKRPLARSPTTWQHSLHDAVAVNENVGEGCGH